ncbi:MAG: hypothetical protein AABZ12_09275 [Planctomycetota bacterium]
MPSETKENGGSRVSKRRVVTWAAALLLLAAGGVWIRQRRPIHVSFYTDAESIREPASTTTPRDILWQPPVRLTEPINSAADDYEPRLTADGLTMYFVRGKAGHNADVYRSTRTPGGWAEPRPMASINSEADDLGPEPTADNEAIYFYSNRDGGLGGYDIWVARRIGEEWSEPVNLGPQVNSEFNDYGLAVTAEGALLYFSSNRPAPADTRQPNPNAWPATLREDLFHRTYDLYVAAIGDRGIEAAAALTALNTSFNEGSPAVSPFGDFVYFSSDRPGGQGGFDLYRARRLDSEYLDPINLGATVNTSAHELDPGLSMGGYALHFSSDRPINAPGASVTEVFVAATPRVYDLYQTTSREVFVRTDESRRQPIDWAGLWTTFGPNLLWALLALLLLLLMLALFQGMRERKLSLVARCLMASIAAHLLLMLLFNAWEVAAGVAGEIHRRGALQVTIAAPFSGIDLAAQLLTGLTDAAPPEVEPASSRRMEALHSETSPPGRASFSVEPRAASRDDAGWSPKAVAEESTPPSPWMHVEPTVVEVPQPRSTPAVATPPAPAVTATSEPKTVRPEWAGATTGLRQVVEEAVRVEMRPERLHPAPPTSARPPLAETSSAALDEAPLADAAWTPTVNLRHAPGPAPSEPAASLFVASLRTPRVGHRVAALEASPVVHPAAAALGGSRPDIDASPPTAVDVRSGPWKPDPARTEPASRTFVVKFAAEGVVGAPTPGPASLATVAGIATELPPSTRLVETVRVPSESALRHDSREVSTASGAPTAIRSTAAMPSTSRVDVAASGPLRPLPAIELASTRTEIRAAALTLSRDPVPRDAAVTVVPQASRAPTADTPLAMLPLRIEVPREALPPPAPDETPPAGDRSGRVKRTPAGNLTNGDQATTPVPDAIGAVRGRVTDALTREPLSGTTIRLTLVDRPAILARTDDAGAYAVLVPEVPEFFALSASLDGFVPGTANVERERMEGGVVGVDFALDRMHRGVLMTEADPEVHHLGDDRFDGTINSQFQRESEGSRYAAEFELPEEELSRPYRRAEVMLWAKGVQRRHKIVVNGITLKRRLDRAPDDGSFGEFRAPMDAALIQAGRNTLEIVAAPSDVDIDDFEFVNVRVRLTH